MLSPMPPLDPVLLTQRLVRCPSVTPADAGAIDVLRGALRPLGFVCHRLTFQEPGFADVDNLYARFGAGAPHLVFAGHTDVVPPGDTAAWQVDPFAAEIRDGRLYGRGAADMKGAIGAFVAAAAAFLADRPAHGGGTISLLISGDEERDAVNGTPKLLDWLAERGERLDACIVGEPTSAETLGDQIKIGRRGSLNARLVVRGRQGHTAYPQHADNPVNRLVRMLYPLLAAPLDHGSPHFEPSNLEVTSIDVGNPAANVVPAEARAVLNVRFNDLHDSAAIKRRLQQACTAVGGDYALDVQVSGESFLTPPGALVDRVVAAVRRVIGREPALSTGGGTSDARFIKDYCPVVECGLVGTTIHQVDEHAAVDDIRTLTRIYRAILEETFPAPGPA